MYQYKLNCLKVMIRGAIIGLINTKSLGQLHPSFDDGSAVALMSNDTDSVVNSAQMFHETWAQIIEVLLGTYLLTRKVGWISLVPLIIIFCELPLTNV
jgi:ATP-binding cassette, subfamily C (CFTR/MRP), member 1